MKKLIYLTLLFLLLTACVPAQAQTTPLPPTQTPTAIVLPTATPQMSGRITFLFSYTNDIPRELFQGSDVERELVVFAKTADGWNSVELKPQIMDLGPLYQIFLAGLLENAVGNCGINTVNFNNMTTGVVVQPICETIDPEESAKMQIGIYNCHKDSFGNILCTISTETGSLRYALNSKLDKFQFIVDGSYNYEYEEWIRLATNGLGFDPVPENYFDKITPGQNNVILKYTSSN